MISIPIALISDAIVPRALGSVLYGNYYFLTNQFLYIIGLLENGASIAFYTKLSKRLQEKELIQFYWYFAIVVTFSIFLFVPFSIVTGFHVSIFPNQEIIYIWMAMGYGLLYWNSKIVSQILDAYGFTKQGEIGNIIQKLLGITLLIILYFCNYLTLKIYFYYLYFITIVLIFNWSYVLYKNKIAVFPLILLSMSKVKSYIHEFYIYLHPLFTFTVVSGLLNSLDILLLQKFGGASEVGFFGLSYRLSSVSFLAASAFTPLITREFSIAFEKKNKGLIRKLFQTNVPFLFSIVSYFSIFISINSSKLVLFFGGESFQEAKFSFMIMALYPIHQIYGQILGALLYATDQTKLYRNIGTLVAIFSLPISFFLIAKKQYGGLELGALGLALKFVTIQFVSISIMLWYSTKFLKISFRYIVFNQLIVISSFFLFAISSNFIVNKLFKNLWIQFLVSGFLYTIFILVLFYIFPRILTYNIHERDIFINSNYSDQYFKKRVVQK